MYMGLDTFESYDPKRAAALADYYAYARDNDAYLTYVIINPQADRSKTAAQQQTEFLSAGVVDREATIPTMANRHAAPATIRIRRDRRRRCTTLAACGRGSKEIVAPSAYACLNATSASRAI